MRKLRALCNKLRRIGVRAYVVSHGRGDYVTFTDRSNWVLIRHSFSTLRDCEQFLLTLFR